MSNSLKIVGKQVTLFFSWVLIMSGATSFFVGGRAIHEFTKTDRLLAELEGIVLAVVLVGIGTFLRARRIESPRDDCLTAISSQLVAIFISHTQTSRTGPTTAGWRRR